MASPKGRRRIRQPEDLERVSILAIEGMAAMIGPLSSILRSFRFHDVQVLGNSEEAWSRLLNEPKQRPDILVIDWNAHPIAGQAFVHHMRRAEPAALAEIPVIALIAQADRPTVLAARDCGVNAVLLRPFSAAQLMEKVIWTLGQEPSFVRAKNYIGPDRRRFRTEEYLGEKRRASELSAAG